MSCSQPKSDKYQKHLTQLMSQYFGVCSMSTWQEPHFNDADKLLSRFNVPTMSCSSPYIFSHDQVVANGNQVGLQNIQDAGDSPMSRVPFPNPVDGIFLAPAACYFSLQWCQWCYGNNQGNNDHCASY